MNIQKRKLIVIVGPTASGKTAVGVKLAKEFDGEIVSADSRQVFRGLDLGTGKDLNEYDEIKYHLIDIKDSGEKFTLFDYLPLARKAIEDIFSRGKVPIIVGGTGLYVQALTEGFVLEKSKILNPKSETNSKFKTPNSKIYSREQLDDLTLEQLQNILKEINPKILDRIDQKNPRRLIRAIERVQEGEIVSKEKPDFEVLQIGLDWPKETLNQRIDKRVDDRFEQGMLEEVETLLESGISPLWLINLGLEYRIITEYILNCHPEFISGSPNDGMPKQVRHDKNSKEFTEMNELLKLRSHQYAKRQMTWLRRFPEIVWENDAEKIKDLVRDFLE